jgi:hypothetical protein
MNCHFYRVENDISPQWNVFLADWNGNKVVSYNIFRHTKFKNECDVAWKKCHNNKSLFGELVERSLMYYFWSKCEWEILIYDFPYNENFKPSKVDVYDQVILNWDRFIEYLWRHYEEEGVQ